MAAIVTSGLSKLGDALAANVSALLCPRTKDTLVFPESIRIVLQDPDVLEVYSLDPDDYESGEPANRIHGHAILGSVSVRSARERKRIGRALIEGNRRTRPEFKCFDPFMGVAAERDGQRILFAACFWCGNVAVTCPDGSYGMYPLSAWPARLLRRQLAAARIVVVQHSESTRAAEQQN